MKTGTLPTIALLGVGAMGGALLRGVLGAGVMIDGSVRVLTKSAPLSEELSADPRVTAFCLRNDADAYRHAVRGAGIVILGVKPAQVRSLLNEIAPHLEDGATVVSIAAGITTATMEEILPEHTAVVRVMPNSPSQVRAGTAGIAGGSRASEVDLTRAIILFSTVGEAIVVPEDRMDDLTAISGTGPAYVFRFIEALTRAACARGFSPEEAKFLVERTVTGAVALLEHSGETPEKLRIQVTSPGGTTQAAIELIDAEDFDGVLDRATAAAVRRAGELARG